MENTIEGTESCLQALSQQYRAIAHNLANANTAGFKRTVSTFMQALRAELETESPEEFFSTPVEADTSIDFSQGVLINTRRPLDVGVSGRGFLVVDTPEGPRYTRNGVLQVNPLRQLTDGLGGAFAGEGGPIVLPGEASGDRIQIAPNGQVSVGESVIGKLRLVEFADPTALEPVGNNRFRAPQEAAPLTASETTVCQGFQESSNVNAVEELVNLITVSRLYEANIKMVKVQDERMRTLLHAAMV
jgi:flagellar basal-body rod protein FlgF